MVSAQVNKIEIVKCVVKYDSSKQKGWQHTDMADIKLPPTTNHYKLRQPEWRVRQNESAVNTTLYCTLKITKLKELPFVQMFVF